MPPQEATQRKPPTFLDNSGEKKARWKKNEDVMANMYEHLADFKRSPNK
jgi:hypothetical protein